jgi:hypothetical protein
MLDIICAGCAVVLNSASKKILLNHELFHENVLYSSIVCPPIATCNTVLA